MLLDTYQRELEGLQAEDALRQAEIIAMGTGQLTKSDRNKVLNRWRSALDGHGPKMLKGNKAGLAMLRAMGVEVKEDGSR